MRAEQVKAAMRRRWCVGAGWALAFEILDQSGFDGTRRMDAVAVGLWWSLNLRMHAFEIKTSRADLRRELRQPEKALEAARYCDTFSLVVPDTVKVTTEELPEGWGLYKVKADPDFKPGDGPEGPASPLYPRCVRQPAIRPDAEPDPKRHYDPARRRYQRDSMTFDRSSIVAFIAALEKGRR